jgi:hypothetical protein
MHISKLSVYYDSNKEIKHEPSQIFSLEAAGPWILPEVPSVGDYFYFFNFLLLCLQLITVNTTINIIHFIFNYIIMLSYLIYFILLSLFYIYI